MAKAAVEIEGLKDFQRDLRALGPEWPKVLRKKYRKISEHLAPKAQARARRLGSVHAKAAPLIRPYATAKDASIGVAAGGVGAVGVFGAKAHTGWYARPRYDDSPPQHPPWVGNNWEPGVAGQGPYAINETIAGEREWIEEAFLSVVDEVTREAFPGGRR